MSAGILRLAITKNDEDDREIIRPRDTMAAVYNVAEARSETAALHPEELRASIDLRIGDTISIKASARATPAGLIAAGFSSQREPRDLGTLSAVLCGAPAGSEMPGLIARRPER